VLLTGLPLNPLALLIAFVMGVAVTLAASAFPAAAASRVSPMDALRPSRQPGRTLWGRLRWIVVLELALGCVQAFVTGEFQGGRHARRVEKIGKLEAEF
jgi:ribose 5-phosphate isomerase RpiB